MDSFQNIGRFHKSHRFQNMDSCNSYHGSLHVLEGDLAGDAADPPACHQAGQVSVLQCTGLEGWLAPRTNNMCLARLDFLDNFFSQWFHWAEAQGRALVCQVN